MATDLTRRLADDLTPLGGACTSVRFFEPTRAFFDAMLPFRGLDVFDIGAGQGHVTLALRAEGHAVTGLDIRENTVGGIVANATCYPYPAGAVGLFCRPCHGPWFVEPGGTERWPVSALPMDALLRKLPAAVRATLEGA